VGLEEPLLFLE